MKTKTSTGTKTGAALAAAVVLIMGFEGLRTHAYKDTGGVPTICYGETAGVKMGDVKTVTECKALLTRRASEFASHVDKCLTRRVPDSMWVTFVDFSYNVGWPAFCRSTLLKKANAGDFRGSCAELKKWVYDNGKKVKGLVNRRQKEYDSCVADL